MPSISALLFWTKGEKDELLTFPCATLLCLKIKIGLTELAKSDKSLRLKMVIQT